MSNLFDELMASIDSLTDEQATSLVAAISARRPEVIAQTEEKEQFECPPVACPHCGGAEIKKHGLAKSGTQRYKCKYCKKTFSETNRSLIHHSRLTSAQWKGLLLGMVQNLSLSQIAEMIGVSVTTVWLNKQKVCKALQDLFGKQDQFVDIAECDEWYTPVSFKGKRDPEFFINVLGRMPRHHKTYEEKLEYLENAGLLNELKKDPERLEMLLSTSDSYKRGISNEQTCILTCRDRSGNLYIGPTCVGRLETADLQKHLGDRFADDAILVTDSHAAYPSFALTEGIQLEQIESGKHTNGAYNLGRINGLHSNLSSFYPEQAERAPATKYLDLSLMLFWWLTKNSEVSTNDKVYKLYDIMTGKHDIKDADYKSITNRELKLNTKGEFPTKV